MIELPSGAVLLDGSTSAGNPALPVSVVNTTDVATEDVWAELQRSNAPLMRAMEEWVAATRPPLSADYHGAAGTGPGSIRDGGLFARDRYVTPNQIFAQMNLAYEAMANDDVVAGVAETTESLAFSAVSFYAEDEDDEDVYNQIAADLELDARLREMWRELFAVSQVYVAPRWGRKTYRVRGTTKDGNQRRKVYNLWAPLSLTILNPTKIVPVGSPLLRTFLNEDVLAYVADRTEDYRFRDQGVADPLVEALIAGPYQPDRAEAMELREVYGVDPSHLWLLKPGSVFRHCATMPAYRRLSDVRMRSVFELLDMKAQLRQMERAHLIGGTNFIVLITKGTDAHPALPAEVANLQAQVKTVARTPILVGDHRLHVDIVTPRLDNTLRPERWNSLDSRITARLYQMFMLGNYQAGASSDDSVKLVKVIARGMESRRHMMRRCLERHVFGPLYDGNDALNAKPKLMFHPRSIALDFDANYASFLFDLRQANELSRETILNQFDLDQSLEAELRQREEETYDAIFRTQVPFSAPNPATQDPATQPSQNLPRDNGGGRRNGGGAAPGTGQGQAPRRATRPSRTAAANELTISVEGVDDPVVAAKVKAALEQHLKEIDLHD